MNRFLISIFVAVCLSYASTCEREKIEAITCAGNVVERLQLTDSIPEVACPNRVDLVRLDGETYYIVTNIGPACNSITVAYNCAGESVCTLQFEEPCSSRFSEEAEQISVLGYY